MDNEYQDLFNNIPGGAFLCGQDEHCIMTEVNQGFLELTGFGREELEEQFGCSFAAMLHPADQKDVMERMLSLAEDKDKAFVNCDVRTAVINGLRTVSVLSGKRRAEISSFVLCWMLRNPAMPEKNCVCPWNAIRL